MIRERLRMLAAELLLSAGMWIASSGCAERAAAPPELVIQSGHPNAVFGMRVSEDGSIAVTHGGDDSVRVWDLRAARLRMTIPVEGYIHDVALSKDGRLAVGQYHRVRVYEIETGRLLAEFEDDRALDQDSIRALAFEPDDPNTLAVAHEKGPVAIYTASNGCKREELGLHLNRIVRAMTFSPDGRRLATIDESSRIAIWDTRHWEAPLVFQATTGAPSAVAFAPDGTNLVSAVSRDHDVVLEAWRLKPPGRIRKKRIDQLDLPGLTFSHDGATLAVGGFNDLLLLDAATWQIQRSLRPELVDAGHAAFIDRDSTIVTTSQNGLELWSAQSGKPIRSIEGLPFKGFWQIVFGPDSSTVAAGTLNEVFVWKLGNPGFNRSFSCKGPCGNFSFSADGSLLATGRREAHLVWSSAGAQEPRTLSNETTRESAYFRAVFAPNGHRLAALLRDDTPAVWDLDTDRRIELRARADRVVWLDYFAPETLMVTDAGSNVCLADLGTATYVWCHRYPYLQWVAARDGRLAVAADGAIELLYQHGSIPKRAWRTAISGFVSCLAFDPRGRWLFVCNEGQRGSRSLEVYDLRTGTRLRGLDAPMAEAEFGISADGRYLAYVDESRTSARIVDAADGKELTALSAVNAAHVIRRTPDGFYMASPPLLDGLAFRTAGHVVPADSVDATYNRPDIVLGRIGRAPPGLIAAYARAHRARLEHLGSARPNVVGPVHTPEVNIVGRIPASIQTKHMGLKLRAHDAVDTLDKLDVYANGARVAAVSLRERRVHDVVVDVTLELADGDNELEVLATDEHGVASLPETTNIKYDGPFTPRTLYVASVGISDYPDSSLSLALPARDAATVWEVLRHSRQPFKIVPVSGGDSGPWKRERILKLKAELSHTRADDVVVLFVAGHARIGKDGGYYFAPFDVRWRDIEHSGLSYEALESLLDAIPAQRKLLLLDTCHAGEARSSYDADTAAILETFVDVRRTSGATVIAATRATEYAREDAVRGQHSAFVSALQTGLAEGAADADQSGDITVHELESYLLHTVPRGAPGQHPVIRSQNRRMDFALY